MEKDFSQFSSLRTPYIKSDDKLPSDSELVQAKKATREVQKQIKRRVLQALFFENRIIGRINVCRCSYCT